MTNQQIADQIYMILRQLDGGNRFAAGRAYQQLHDLRVELLPDIDEQNTTE